MCVKVSLIDVSMNDALNVSYSCNLKIHTTQTTHIFYLPKWDQLVFNFNTAHCLFHFKIVSNINRTKCIALSQLTIREAVNRLEFITLKLWVLNKWSSKCTRVPEIPRFIWYLYVKIVRCYCASSHILPHLVMRTGRTRVNVLEAANRELIPADGFGYDNQVSFILGIRCV